ncbi:MAG: hypothetical protein KDA63_01680 [Planctomycetales bacterium]|nr:hypothetical protein [Planctomycetales bacterium]
MSRRQSRREFVAASAAAGAFSVADLSFLRRLSPVSAADAQIDPNKVWLGGDIEPVVRLLEETPREQLLERVAERIEAGLSYQEVLAALLLAGVRNVQPRPSVGFKFHAVLVVNSAHLASLASSDEDRWLPIFWALDEFKSSQARDVEEGNWTMAPVDESAVPPAGRARAAFTTAMDNWDEPATDAAIAGLARTAGSNELFELFARYGTRDFRAIGHKAIFVANSWRTLETIGWQHSEPVLRSLAYALQNHGSESNPARSDHAADRPWRRNQELVADIPDDWQGGRIDDGATRELLTVLREQSDEDASRAVVGMLAAGVSPQSVYDALLLGAGELLMRQPGIVALHAVTTTNAMRYIFQTVGSDETRRLVLLQNASFLPMFREAMQGRGTVGDASIVELPATAPGEDEAEALGAIFHDVSDDRSAAAQRVLGYLDAGQSAEDLIAAARRLIFLKGDNAHDYKFSSAVLEDYYHVSPEWRNRYLASSVYNLRGSGDRDNSLVQRTRAALA